MSLKNVKELSEMWEIMVRKYKLEYVLQDKDIVNPFQKTLIRGVAVYTEVIILCTEIFKNKKMVNGFAEKFIAWLLTLFGREV